MRRPLPLSLRRRLKSNGNERQTYHCRRCGSAKNNQHFTWVLNYHVCVLALISPNSHVELSLQCQRGRSHRHCKGKGRFNSRPNCVRNVRLSSARPSEVSELYGLGSQPVATGHNLHPTDHASLLVGGGSQRRGSDTDSNKSALTRQHGTNLD